MSIMREFSGGKLKQKGFFHSVEGSVTLFRKNRQVSVAFSLNCRHVEDDKNFVRRK